MGRCRAPATAVLLTTRQRLVTRVIWAELRVVMSAAACASSTDHQKLDNALGKSPTSTSPSADKRVCIDCPAITVFYGPVRSPLLLLASPLAYMYM